MIRNLVIITSLLLAACTQPKPSESVDRIIMGGTIHTGVTAGDTVEVVAIRDGKIVWTGNRENADYFDAAETTDLQGAVMYPGFTDAHAHLFGIGEREISLNLEDQPSLAAMLQMVTEYAHEHPQGVIIGRGWIETHWPEGRMPTRHDLDQAAPGRAVLLVRADGHALVASSKALETSGINAETTDPDGGRLERDEEGAPDGRLVDNAMGLVRALWASASPKGEARRPVLAKGAESYVAKGWTGMHNMSVNATDVHLLEDMAREDDMPLRVYNGINRDAIDLLTNGTRNVADGRVITRAIKIYMDGALGSRGAALLAPYSDDPGQSGLVTLHHDDTIKLFERALRAGWQMEVHAIGDKGNRLTLDWMEEAFNAVPKDEWKVKEPRWRVEHAQILNPTDIARFAQLGIIPSMQPSHAIGDLYFAPARLGSDRLQGAYAWESLIQAGSVIPGGSDAPVEKGDPRIEFFAAIARRGLSDDYQDENWHAEDAVTREQALAMFTKWPAYASFREDELGTIEPGKRADFTVFDTDFMTAEPRDILKAKAVMTIVDGKDVYVAE